MVAIRASLRVRAMYAKATELGANVAHQERAGAFHGGYVRDPDGNTGLPD